MRLQLAALAILGLGILGREASAQSEAPWTVATDTLFYSDTDNVVVFSPQLSVQRRLDDDGGAASARVTLDAISAASVDVVSQATTRFSEVRTQADLALSKRIGEVTPSASYRVSVEPDYLSNGGRLGLAFELGTSDSTASLGYGLAVDRIGRVGTPASVFAERLTTHTADASLTQVLGPKQLVRLVYTMTGQRGYMEKPYRHVPLFDSATLQQAVADGMTLDVENFGDVSLSTKPPESVPDRRLRHAFGVRYLRFFEGLQASLRVDYQFYFDSWGIWSNMVEPRFTVRLAERVRLESFVRLYQQTSADFWQRTYTVNSAGEIPRWRTVDKGLTDYWTTAVGARVDLRLGAYVGYVGASAYRTQFQDYLFLEDRTALIGTLGLRREL